MTARQAKNIPPQGIRHITEYFVGFICRNFQIPYDVLTLYDLRVQIFRVKVKWSTYYHGEIFMITSDPNYVVTVKWLKLKSLIELDYTLD